MKAPAASFVALLGFALSSYACAQIGIEKEFQPAVPAGNEWKLIRQDEFDGREMWRTRAGEVSQVPEYLKFTEDIGEWGGDIQLMLYLDLPAGPMPGEPPTGQLLWASHRD